MCFIELILVCCGKCLCRFLLGMLVCIIRMKLVLLIRLWLLSIVMWML